MSGDTYRSRGGSRGGGGAYDDCDLNFETSLFSPVPSVIATLKENDSLSIVFDESAKTVQVFSPKGKFAGTIIGKHQASLARCIKEGNKYAGTVLEISGGNCKIEIARI